MKSCTACSIFSNLLIVLTHNTKNRLDYTLNTLHYTLYNILTIHSKQTICHKSLNCQNSPSLSLSVSPPASLTQHPCSSATKLAACVLPFLPAPDTKQTWWQCSRKSIVDIIYPRSGFGRAGVSGPSTGEVGRVGGLAASYTWTSTDSNSTLLSLCIRITSDWNRLDPDSFSLINPQQSV